MSGIKGLYGKFKREMDRHGFLYAIRRTISFTFDPTRGHYAEDFDFLGGVEITKERSDWNARPLLRKVKVDNSGKRQLKINWVVPDMDVGSGGHMTLFRLAHYLEQQGHDCRYYIFGKTKFETASEFGKTVREHFKPVNGYFELGTDSMRKCDVLIASTWQTAYAVYKNDTAQRKAYLVQDFEPWFYPKSSESQLAENTYRMNLQAITAGSWLEQKLESEFEMSAAHFKLAYDQAIYYEDEKTERDPNLVAFYARPATARRAWQVGLFALRQLKKMRPETKIVFYGADLAGLPVPIEHESLGILSHKQLGALYRKAAVGLSLSLTNYSLIPQEMMACGLPVVELDGETTRAIFKHKQNILLAPPHPTGIARSLARLLDNKALQEQLRSGGKVFVKDLSWEQAGKEAEEALLQLVR